MGGNSQRFAFVGGIITTLATGLRFLEIYINSTTKVQHRGQFLTGYQLSTFCVRFFVVISILKTRHRDDEQLKNWVLLITRMWTVNIYGISVAFQRMLLTSIIIQKENWTKFFFLNFLVSIWSVVRSVLADFHSASILNSRIKRVRLLLSLRKVKRCIAVLLSVVTVGFWQN